jgi:hypothetical protein
LETLAIDFYKQLNKPLYIELYGANPKLQMKNLLKAIIAVSNHADGVILATHSSVLSKKIQDTLVKNIKFVQFLERHECESMINIIRKWKEIG